MVGGLTYHTIYASDIIGNIQYIEKGRCEYIMYTGRTTIYTSEKVITDENIANVMLEIQNTFDANSLQCASLYKYYKGEQPILHKENEVRPDINNIIIENRANEIISFKTGYLMGEPIQYVSRGGDKKQTKLINLLNTYMNYDSKASKDKELAEWFYICGTAYRIIVPNQVGSPTPFSTYVLNPMNTFVVYSNDIYKEPVLGGVVIKSTNVPTETIYSVYTKDTYYELDETYQIITKKPHILGRVPIIEYPANNARLGAFEIVITILDAINRLQSDRLDAIDNFVQALLVIKNAQLEEGQSLSDIKKQGGLYLPKDADVEYLTQELDQQQTQTLADTMYEAVLTITGMPNRNEKYSAGDTGVAVQLRNGWSSAEARAKDQELMFKQSEMRLLEIACDLMNTIDKSKIDLRDIDIRFTRRNYENIVEKSTVLTTMLANTKIHPKLAFDFCGMFPDSDLAYTMSKEYYDTELDKQTKQLEEVEKVEVYEE